ncbi:hypothetical protein C6P42_001349, partial [Pichia californica]
METINNINHDHNTHQNNSNGLSSISKNVNSQGIGLMVEKYHSPDSPNSPNSPGSPSNYSNCILSPPNSLSVNNSGTHNLNQTIINNSNIQFKNYTVRNPPGPQQQLQPQQSSGSSDTNDSVQQVDITEPLRPLAFSNVSAKLNN